MMTDQSGLSLDESKDNDLNDNGPPVVAPNSVYLLDQVDIAVIDTETRFSPGTVNLRESYTVYLIETRTKGRGDKTPENITNIWRRYSEFETLKAYLQVRYPFIIVPPLPEKGALFSWQNSQSDTLNRDFVDRRKAGLENFILRVAVHSVLSQDKVFLQFLQQEETWNESVATTGYLSKLSYWFNIRNSTIFNRTKTKNIIDECTIMSEQADAKWKSLSATFLIKKPDRLYEDTKNYSNELQSNISNLLKTRAKLANHWYGILKFHENYGRIFSEWSAFEKHMGDSLPKVAHMMTLFSNQTANLNEEEQFIDQMKEYLFFADSLRFVCKKQEMLQYEVERVEDNLTAKVAQRENLLKGKVGFISRWFANVDTDEVRELKLQQIDTQIHETENNRIRASEEIGEFVEKSQQGISQFQEQKVKDLKESLILYAILQIKMCKKGLSVWKNIRDSFESI